MPFTTSLLRSRRLLMVVAVAAILIRTAAAQSPSNLPAATVEKVERAVSSAMAAGHIQGLS
jgi:hypothetical protein